MPLLSRDYPHHRQGRTSVVLRIVGIANGRPSGNGLDANVCVADGDIDVHLAPAVMIDPNLLTSLVVELIDCLPLHDGVGVSSRSHRPRLSHCHHLGDDGALTVCHRPLPVSDLFSTGGNGDPPGGRDHEIYRSCPDRHDLFSARTWKIVRHVAAAFAL